MNKFKYDVSFRVFHPCMKPTEICDTLNMKAKYQWASGEKRRTPKGVPLTGKYDRSFCSFKLNHPKEMELVDFLKYWNVKLFPNKTFLNQIYTSGGRLEYFIGWYSSGNSGEEFDLMLLEGLLSLKINLVIDFYGG